MTTPSDLYALADPELVGAIRALRVPPAVVWLFSAAPRLWPMFADGADALREAGFVRYSALTVFDCVCHDLSANSGADLCPGDIREAATWLGNIYEHVRKEPGLFRKLGGRISAPDALVASTSHCQH